MRLRRLVASSAIVALGVLGLTAAQMGAALAAGEGTPPSGGAMLWTINGGQSDLMIHDNGHTNQADIETGLSGNGLQAVNEETVSGKVYFQIEDETGGADLCLNIGNAPAIKWESCPVDNSNELITMAGTNGNELEFKADSEYLTASGTAAGDTLSVSSTATPSAENQILYSNSDPAEQTAPVDFTADGPTSTDWATLAADANEPESEIHSVIFEVCYLTAPADCGGNQTANDTAWDAPLTTLQDAGVIPLYYISTDYGATPLTTLEASISNAESWYGTYGIGFMFDEVDGTATDNCSSDTMGDTVTCQTYYQDLDDYINGPTADGDLNLHTVVMLNPGDIPTANYFGSYTTDGYELIQVFENDRSQLADIDSANIPAWMQGLPGHEFVATVSGETSADVAGDLATLETDGIENSYLVPDYTSGPDEGQPDYTALPSWLNTEEVDAASFAPLYNWGNPVFTIP
jgi:hypothetical protein